MKFKRTFTAILAAGILALSMVPFAFAEPDDEEYTEETEVTETVSEETSAEDAQAELPTDPPIDLPNVAAQQQTEFTNSKYLTKGWAAFWFILTVVVNGALSFWIGNRFYRLARKDNHVGAEVRALRRDIEDKFSKNIDGFAEKEAIVTNKNESLAMNDEGIVRKAPKKPSIRDLTPEEEERFRKWEEAQSRPRGERTRPRSVVREELQDELDDVKKIKRKNYQPRRTEEEFPPEDEFDEEEYDEQDGDEKEDLDATRVIRTKASSVKSKAKELLSDIFPFKED